MPSPALSFHALTPDRWPDLEALFGARGACAGCWCMWWRIPRKEWKAGQGEGNKRAFRKLVQSGARPGVLAYAGGQPVGWCAVQPREAYPNLERSRTLQRIDEQPVWSIVCFFVLKAWRGQGISVKLLKAAIAHVRDQGGRIVEGYPVDSQNRQADAWVWTGTAAAFRAAGFEEVARPSPTRPIMRKTVRARRTKLQD